MEFFKTDANVDFMSLRRITGVFSVVLCTLSLICIFTFGLNIGLEFTGGTQIELRFANEVNPDDVREKLAESGVSESKVQHYGTAKDILIRIANSNVQDEEKLAANIKSIFSNDTYNAEIRKVEYVGSEVGNELAERGGMAILVAIIATMIYIALRFEYRFAISAAIALCHDAVIVLGVFALLQIEFDLATLASVLAMLGYSLNDTIVVFDRVRENFRKVRKGSTEFVTNLSINQTLSRTIMTSLLTLFVLIPLLLYGGESLFGFSLSFTIGIIVGTYSSIYVAGAFALSMGLSRADLLPKPKAELDDLP